ncbi:hypothetical protein FB555_000014 [Alpinimonas psychrophila]|uniref:Uncharacterized protein n=1 Tax=Alpinimonas psychrophila TaxID=748908 RepID=A0A7W3PN90_9MICO|nr:hypothetical protein [Alpinimonas psychrophila]
MVWFLGEAFDNSAVFGVVLPSRKRFNDANERVVGAAHILDPARAKNINTRYAPETRNGSDATFKNSV